MNHLEHKVIKEQRKEIELLLKELASRDKDISKYCLTEREKLGRWEDLTQRIVKYETKCSKLEYECHARNDKVENLKEELHNRESEFRMKETELNVLAQERDEYKRVNRGLKEKICGLEKRLDKLLSTLEEKANLIGKLEGELQEIRDELSEKSRDLKEASTCLKGMVDKFKVLDSHCRDATVDRDRLMIECKEKELRVKKMNEKFKMTEEELVACKKQRNDHYQEYKSRESECHTLRSEVKYLEEQKEHLKRVLESQNDTLKLQQENLDYYKGYMMSYKLNNIVSSAKNKDESIKCIGDFVAPAIINGDKYDNKICANNSEMTIENSFSSPNTDKFGTNASYKSKNVTVDESFTSLQYKLGTTQRLIGQSYFKTLLKESQDRIFSSRSISKTVSSTSFPDKYNSHPEKDTCFKDNDDMPESLDKNYHTAIVDGKEGLSGKKSTDKREYKSSSKKERENSMLDTQTLKTLDYVLNDFRMAIG
ncbi:unnamed protein product [Gordionus sp. m RMFG-2023]|uniref:uncharacterized protein LOC135926890 n=1 Tax=Gordionus sp. m RMFG-2023 TaxID=3053472 RepID=UPI0030E1D362